MVATAIYSVTTTPTTTTTTQSTTAGLHCAHRFVVVVVVVAAAAALCCFSIALDISFYLLDSTFALQWHNTNSLSLITVKRLQFTGYYKTDHQLRTVLETSGNTFTQGPEIAAHCDS